jgi:hypothetical protein
MAEWNSRVTKVRTNASPMRGHIREDRKRGGNMDGNRASPTTFDFTTITGADSVVVS